MNNTPESVSNFLNDNFREYIQQSVIKGPAIALAYPMYNNPNLRSGKDFLKIELTYEEEPNSDILFFNTMFGILKGLTTKYSEHKEENPNQYIDPRSYHFKMEQIIPKNVPGHLFQNNPSLLSIIVGATKTFYNQPYCDLTEVMYKIDELGIAMIAGGLLNDKKPMWMGSNYNFSHWDWPYKGSGGSLQNESLDLVLSRFKPVGTLQQK
jgi:hypothetical protein